MEGLQEAVRVAEAAAQRAEEGRREATARVVALQAEWDALRAQEQVQRDVAVRQAAELAAARERATVAEAEGRGLREALAEARRPFWRRWLGS